MPSSRRATASRSLTRASVCSRSASGGLSSSARSSVISSWFGISLATRSTSRDRHLHHAADVADGGARLHRAERDDLRDVLAAVLLRDVGDDLAAAPFAEVDVDIGQRHALGIQEALEVQVEVQRIDVRDPQAVRDQAAGRRSAAGADRDALLARVADEVPDDQEVARVFHPPDQVDLVGQPRLVLGDRPAQLAARLERRAAGASARRSPARDDLLEVRVERVARRHGEVRQVRLRPSAA